MSSKIIRLSDDQEKDWQRLKTRLQLHIGPLHKVSDRTLALFALDRLDAYFNRLDKDKERER